MANISNQSRSGSGSCSGIGNDSGNGNGSGISISSGVGSGLCPNIGSNDDEVDFGMHTNNESEENTTDNQMLYEINEEESNDSDVELVKLEWQLL